MVDEFFRSCDEFLVFRTDAVEFTFKPLDGIRYVGDLFLQTGNS